jgi:hypothetical protein
MPTKVFGDKGGFTASPRPNRPTPPAPKKGSPFVWVLALIVILAVAFVAVQKSGNLEAFLPGSGPASNQESK